MSGVGDTHLPVRGGKYEHIQAQEAKEHHGRPQDKDAPDFSRLNKGERVSFQTHSHAGIGIVEIAGDEVGTMEQRFGTSLATHEGRGPYKGEMCYEVLDEATGVSHALRRGEVHVVGSADDAHTSQQQRDAERYTDFADRVVPEGSFAAHETQRKPPHRK